MQVLRDSSCADFLRTPGVQTPAIVVPGIYYSDDKLLQTRSFSYADTQRHRLGPNYLQLPANAPKCGHHNNRHEGFMNFMHRDEENSSPTNFVGLIVILALLSDDELFPVNYFPSRFDPVRHSEKYPIPSAIYTGKHEKCIIPKENNFKQPGERYRPFAPDRQERFIHRWVEALFDSRVSCENRSIWVSYWSQGQVNMNPNYF